MLIPNDLRHAHEDGEVVFFCGAGVSQSAGLPSFKALVHKVLTDLLPPRKQCLEGDPARLAWAAYCRGEYDDALGLLEFDPTAVRDRVRHHLSSPKTDAPEAHKALIRLSGLDRGRGRLVTTNFDRLFETAYASLPGDHGHIPQLNRHVGPALPPARASAFQGLLYLHGRLEEEPTDDDKNLVLTRSDFGSAYLLDGWARRFVVDLFRHYNVVFVGYSVEDPTMRYLVSAMAAVREEAPTLFRPAYSFASCSDSSNGIDKDRAVLTWKSKGIQPILYDNTDGYAELWDSIQAWADQHRRGLAAHRQTVVRLGHVRLTGKDDDRIDEMAWALREPKIAKFFADRVEPARPDPAWIAALQDRRLLDRPKCSPDDPDSPRAPLAFRQLGDFVAPDDTTAHLSRWIARCLEDRHTLHWALTQGCVLHSTLRRDIRCALEDAQSELPIALRKVWRVLARDDYASALSRMKATNRSSLPLCKGLSAEEHFARNTLLHWLRPVPVFQMQEPGFLGTKKDYENDPSQWYTLDLAFEGIDHKSEIAEIKQAAADWNGALGAIADELTSLLKEAMDWFNEFGKANPHYDLTHIHYRSISPHKQTEVAPIWTELVGLCRDAHDALVESEQFAAAERLVDRWRSLHYPVFRRLAVHAATNSKINPDLGVDLLLNDKYPPLWDHCLTRETLRFLRKRGGSIQKERLDVLLREVLLGPPREQYLDGLTDDQWKRWCGHEIRRRLEKLNESKAHLSKEAIDMYNSLPEDQTVRPRSGGSHREEFDTFIAVGWGGVPDFEDPATVGELKNWPIGRFVEWAREYEHQIWTLGTAWEEFVRRDRPAAAHRLLQAGEHDCWPRGLWSQLLYVVEDGVENGDKKALRAVSAGLSQMPAKALAEVSVEASRWLSGNRTELAPQERLVLWNAIWQASLTSDDTGEAGIADLVRALNHAGGILGEILFAELADDIPNVGPRQNPGLPRRLREEFALIGEGESLSCRFARISMAARLVELYRIDPTWADNALLSRMGNESGGSVGEAGLWEGYFAGRQCSEDLLAAFKEKLLGVLKGLGKLSARARAGAVHHFIHLAIWQDRGISREDAKAVAWEWDQTSLAEAAWAIADVLAAAGNRADVLWEELVGPWFLAIWPGRKKDKTPAVSEALCRIALAVNVTFPDVVETIRDFLVPRLRDDSLDLVAKRKLATRFPEATATLLGRIVDEGDDEDSKETAHKLLREVMKAKPSLRERQEFERLSALLETDPDSETD